MGDTLIMIMQENIVIGKHANLNFSENKTINTKLGFTGLNYFFKKIFQKNKINLYRYKKDKISTKKNFFKNSSFTSMITVTINKIKSNGNLNFIGKKKIMINDHKEVLYVSGTIDPKNISKKKLINSIQVANLNIKYFESKKNNSKKINWFKNFFSFF
ncbi:flagellar basal body L-ring protein FlgH [Buchnera aphidicola]|uniref:flagellar basal body L-ring protein FlgH n=1 Tax=Buchnera aphidicola TaxID=9 RepID=UPI003464E2AA